MKIAMSLQKEPFEMIKNGKKIYELRLLDEKRKLVKIGDEIEFYCQALNQKLTALVVDILVFSNFAELYATLSPLEIGYTEQTSKTARPEDMLYYYSKEEQERFGVVAIKIKI